MIGIFAAIICLFAISMTIISCGDDEKDNGGQSTGGTTTGGGATANDVVGTYKAITAGDYSVTAIFAENGTGIITEKYYDSYSGDGTYQTHFTYSKAGDNLIITTDDSYSGSDTYVAKFVEGFMLLEENGDEDDIEYVFYKQGRDLGQPAPQKFIGSWYSTNRNDNSYCTINNDGTGLFVEDYMSGNYHQKEETSFTYRIINSYIGECTILEQSSYSGSSTYTMNALVLSGKLYVLDDDGDVDWIFTKR